MSVTLNVVVRLPEAAGVKVTLMVQLAPTARLAPQPLVWAKSPLLVPVIAMLLIVNGALPLFVSVTAWAALVVLTDWFPNPTEVGDRLAAGAVPVPVRLAVRGLPVPLSVTVSVALRVPEAVGLKVTLMVQLAAAARLAPQPFVRAKSPLLVPVMATLLMVSDELVPFFRVSVCAVLVVPTA